MFVDFWLLRSGGYIMFSRIQRLSDGDDHGTGNDKIVRESTLERTSVGQGEVRNSSNALGNLATVGLAVLGEHGTAGEDTTGGETAVGSARSLTLGLDLGLDLDGVGSVHGELGERLDGEVGALGTGLDEGSGEGEDGAGTESGIKCLGDGDLAAKDTDGRLVSGFDGEDGAGNAQDGGVLEERSGAKVGGDTDVLEDGGSLDHRGSVGEAKLVLAGLDGLDAVLGEGGLQERDVLGLGLANLLEVGNFDVVEAEGLEVGVGELGESLTVEGLLEVFQGQSTVRDGLVGVRLKVSRRGGREGLTTGGYPSQSVRRWHQPSGPAQPECDTIADGESNGYQKEPQKQYPRGQGG